MQHRHVSSQLCECGNERRVDVCDPRFVSWVACLFVIGGAFHFPRTDSSFRWLCVVHAMVERCSGWQLRRHGRTSSAGVLNWRLVSLAVALAVALTFAVASAAPVAVCVSSSSPCERRVRWVCASARLLGSCSVRGVGFAFPTVVLGAAWSCVPRFVVPVCAHSRVSVAVNTGIATTGSNAGASLEAGEPSPLGDGVGGASVWYSWTPEYAGEYLVTLAGSDFDTILSVYSAADTVAELAQVLDATFALLWCAAGFACSN